MLSIDICYAKVDKLKYKSFKKYLFMFTKCLFRFKGKGGVRLVFFTDSKRGSCVTMLIHQLEKA